MSATLIDEPLTDAVLLTLDEPDVAVRDETSLFPEPPLPQCHACVTVPARNEEAALPAMLDALRNQYGVDGTPLPHSRYEVLLLLNNCTDRSEAVARTYAESHPELQLHLACCSLSPEQAHVGTARSLLLDAACTRMERLASEADPGGESLFALLTTDADTEVAPDWIARNLQALALGADAVGGVIHLRPGEHEALDPQVRVCYERDRQLQALVARLESLLDPDPADPWPRHLEHFGASLACTPKAYRRAGGLPAVKPLEDVAFVDALRRAGASIRHAPDVHIYTSARMDGRAEVGLSGQMRHWKRECDEGLPHTVDSAAWMVHRFSTMGVLRRVHAGESMDALGPKFMPWRSDAERLCHEEVSFARFLERLDANRMIEETFDGERRAEIGEVLREVEAEIARMQGKSSHAGRR